MSLSYGLDLKTTLWFFAWLSPCLLPPFFWGGGHATGSYFPNQGSKLCCLQWKCGALTAGPSGNSFFSDMSFSPLRSQWGHSFSENSQSWLPTPTSKPHCWETGVTKSCDLQENTGFANSSLRIHPTEVSASVHIKTGMATFIVSSKLEITQMSSFERILKTGAYSYREIFQSRPKEQTSDVYNNTSVS